MDTLFLNEEAEEEKNILKYVEIKAYHSDLRIDENVKEISISSQLSPEAVKQILSKYSNTKVLHLSRNKENWEQLFELPKLQSLIINGLEKSPKRLQALQKLKNLKKILVRGFVRGHKQDPMQLLTQNLKYINSLQNVQIISRIPPVQAINQDYSLKINWFEGFPSLTTLRLKGVNIKYFKSSEAKNILGQLKEIYLNNCALSSMSLLHEMIPFLKSLKVFKLNSYYGNNSQIQSVIRALPSLEKLGISYYHDKKQNQCFIEQAIIQNHPQLLELSISGYMGPSQKFRVLMKGLNKLQSIIFLERHYTKPTRRSPPIYKFTLTLENARSLVYYRPNLLSLQLSSSPIQKGCVELIATHLKDLKTLSLNLVKEVTVGDLMYLGKLKKIQVFNVGMSFNDSTKMLIKALRNMKQLKKLNLQSYFWSQTTRSDEKASKNVKIIKPTNNGFYNDQEYF